MNKLSSPDLNNLAEGQAHVNLRDEQPAKDTNNAPMLLIHHAPISETGYMLRVRMSGEGTDSAEAQDAPLTANETQADSSSTDFSPPVPVKEMSTEPQAEVSISPVLIVEDTVELAEVIQATIEGMGLSAEYATHGKRALERMKNITPKLIILDIGLPDITGWEMLKQIREKYQRDKQPAPPIVVVTAYGDPANRLIGKLQEISSYLIKPFTPDQIERVVKQALEVKPETPPAESKPANDAPPA